MIAHKSYGIYTLATKFLLAGKLMYNYQILQGYQRPMKGGLSVQVRALGFKFHAGEILRSASLFQPVSAASASATCLIIFQG